MCDLANINFDEEPNFEINFQVPPPVEQSAVPLVQHQQQQQHQQQHQHQQLALNYKTGAGINVAPLPPGPPFQIGVFGILANGNARMPLSENKKVVVSTFRNHVYLHFFGPNRKDHFSLNRDEIDVFLNNIEGIKYHLAHHRKELEKYASMRTQQQQLQQQQQQQQQAQVPLVQPQQHQQVPTQGAFGTQAVGMGVPVPTPATSAAATTAAPAPLQFAYPHFQQQHQQHSTTQYTAQQ